MILLLACSTDPVEVRQEVDLLEAQRDALQSATRALEVQEAYLSQRQASLQQQVALLEAQAAGKKVRYVLRVELRQSHISLDPWKHVKDAANAVEFDVVTDQDTYESAKRGDTLLKQFRNGSLLTEGSVGEWEITVLSKRVEVVP